MTGQPIVTLALASSLAGACRPIVPEDDTEVSIESPDSVSDLLDAFWLEYDTEDAELPGTRVAAMPAILDPDALLQRNAWFDGEQRRFGPKHLDLVELYAPPDDNGSWARPDPAKARPVFIATRYECSFQQLSRILVHRDQKSLYDEAYLEYERTWDADGDAFLAGDRDQLGWTFDLRSTYPLAGEFTEFAHGEIRRHALPIGDRAGWIGDSFLVQRVWLPYPAARDNEGIGFEQDYQLEIYVPWEGDTILHLYGVWRELTTPFGDFEGGIATLTVDNLKRWDEQTATLCAEGRP